MISAETCVCCGQIIPEGRQVCRMCEISAYGSPRVSGNKTEPMQTTTTNPKNAYIQKAVERLFKSYRNRKHKRIKE